MQQVNLSSTGPTDEAFLVKFLRARKYNVERACDSIKKYFACRRENPDIFEGLTPDCIPFDVACRQHQLVTVSRKKDPKGRVVFLINGGMWNTNVCSMNDLFKVEVVHMEQMLLDEAAQIKGFVAVYNLKGLGVHHLAQYTPSVIRKLIQLVQDCLPMRIKAVYIINNPPLFDALFSIAKPFMKAKLLQRTHLLGNDADKMRELLPDDLIPEEHGGSLERYDYDEIKRELESKTKFFEDLNRCGYQQSRDEFLLQSSRD
ncbi:hypothetical protein HPB48_019266 [Haemaphysalis longicornis]|uniref:CRAL-TRIO domain-containing protein n=1 Tax=Haemaphysalis longicornis TaxID=44386 RepID=A0A9J6GDL8_HAELO|nr:hypothetical protein HPB48_019266 [Haemaphysalis longicornis]